MAWRPTACAASRVVPLPLRQSPVVGFQLTEQHTPLRVSQDQIGEALTVCGDRGQPTPGLCLRRPKVGDPPAMHVREVDDRALELGFGHGWNAVHVCPHLHSWNRRFVCGQ